MKRLIFWIITALFLSKSLSLGDLRMKRRYIEINGTDNEYGESSMIEKV